MTTTSTGRPATTLATWDAHYEAGRGWRPITDSEAVAHAAHLAPATPGERALDIGCGTGELAGLLQEWGYEATGVDWAPAAIAQAKVRHPNVTFRCADLADLAGDYDLITARLVYPVIADQDAFLATVGRLLRPGGRLAVIAPLATELTTRQHVGLTDEHLQELADWADHTGRYEHAGLRVILCGRTTGEQRPAGS
ncbi:class I SAM-dependent methyltransferase [Streptomyces sp. NBC_01221]|uniref:class I SAM-dependent methyltransferase n=1 Tax=Streptomyces sp. NBC_01221 TaxID=2903782 RepID=UPI002255246B|nr:class I SAM-dependent methyltransferase [Streptomyces sp. NBC_01221]MCX4792531.1 class I SAM-dependent methyltransferase [Streptomyces sp. NBC_01221]